MKYSVMLNEVKGGRMRFIIVQGFMICQGNDNYDLRPVQL